jgi:hypothetical protein
MSLPYDLFTDAFLSKVTEYELIQLDEYNRTSTIDGYMKRAISQFQKVCTYDLTTTANDLIRAFTIDVSDEDMDELAEIISEGMLVQWLKPYMYKQEILENVLNTKDFSMYSTSELILRIGDTYKDARKNFTQMIREYSYNHGDLTGLHL